MQKEVYEATNKEELETAITDLFKAHSNLRIVAIESRFSMTFVRVASGKHEMSNDELNSWIEKIKKECRNIFHAVVYRKSSFGVDVSIE